MAKRTHVPKLLRLARALCKAITIARPVILREFPSNTALIAALEAAMAACSVLESELEAEREYGV